MRTLIIVSALTATLGVGGVAAAPRPGEPVLGWFGGASAQPAIVDRLASTAVMSPVVGQDGATVIASNFDGKDPGRLYRAGAWLVVNAEFAFRCLPLDATQSSL